MTISVVVKSFPYSADGINSEILKPGRKLDFGRATKGLTDEKYIEPVKADKASTITEEKVAETEVSLQEVNETQKPNGSKKKPK